MDAIQMFLDSNQRIHSDAVPRLLEQLSELQVRSRPSPSVNSVAWIIWHMARTEDFGINRFVTDREQVLSEAWLQRLVYSPSGHWYER